MSNNSTNTSSRLIEIKPVHLPKEELDTEVVDLEEKSQLAEKMIDEAKEKAKDVEAKASHKLQEAQGEIQQQKEVWQQEKEELQEKAKEAGFQAGFQEGERKGFQQYSDKLEEANDLIAMATKDYHSTVASSEETIMDIAVKSAEKILNHELTTVHTSLVEVVKKAIEEVQGQPEIVLNVHPEDYPIIHSQKSELDSITEFNSTLRIYMKESIERFGCIIESPFGQINAGVGPQLQELREKLYQLVQEEKLDE
ncbi:flagellar assembly protein FliH [Halobacillus seohaensis]|uniref:Flagellar assembly protein FliH n=1 Tax=Halobacillus seohaensis TaxID=447421 RepID=A0ABW2EG23_9BACI